MFIPALVTEALGVALAIICLSHLSKASRPGHALVSFVWVAGVAVGSLILSVGAQL